MRLKTAFLALILIGVGALVLIAGSVLLVTQLPGDLGLLATAAGSLSIVVGMALQLIE